MNDDLTTPGADPSLSPGSGDTGAEARGCLFALSQPPLMLFLAVIGTLLLITALHDLFQW